MAVENRHFHGEKLSVVTVTADYGRLELCPLSRQQRLGGDSDDGSMSDGSDAGMGSYSSGSESDEETGNSALSSKLASQVATDDIEAELEALESGDQQLLMPKRQESDKDRARDTRHQIVSASCC